MDWFDSDDGFIAMLEGFSGDPAIVGEIFVSYLLPPETPPGTGPHPHGWGEDGYPVVPPGTLGRLSPGGTGDITIEDFEEWLRTGGDGVDEVPGYFEQGGDVIDDIIERPGHWIGLILDFLTEISDPGDPEPYDWILGGY